jgi:hypothetical protein
MKIPSWVRALMVATVLIPGALILIEALKFGAFPLLFAAVIGAPIFLLGRRHARKQYERDEQRWAEWEARRGRR